MREIPLPWYKAYIMEGDFACKTRNAILYYVQTNSTVQQSIRELTILKQIPNSRKIWLTVLLAIPGFALWAGAYFGYKIAKRRRTEQVAPLIEAKYEEGCTVCEKARQLL